MPNAINTLQPGLGLTQYILTQGVYPQREAGGSAFGSTLASIHTFAGNFAPNGSFATSGQVLSLSQNTALFSLLGTQYGGNGTTNFALPDLQASVTIATGQGPGLGNYSTGQEAGATTFTLAQANLTASSGGAAAPVSTYQPSTAIDYSINSQGLFPQNGGGGGGPHSIGSVHAFAGNFPMSGLALNGQLLNIAEHEYLFQILGTTYGGDGQVTFGLPDLRGRVMVGATTERPVGTYFGGNTAITQANMPTNMGGSGTAISNLQPSVSVNFLIALSGIFPSPSGGQQGDSDPYIGEIFARFDTIVPNGYARAEGQLLPINQNQALFALLGTTYGGNGTTNFALPDLRGRTIIDTGTANGTTVALGQTVGSTSYTLTSADIPALNFSGDGNDNMLYGGDDNDNIYGLGGVDTIIGNGGNDRLDGGTGADSLNGGVGNDTYVVDNAGDSITETSGTDTVETTLATYTLGAGLENLTGLNSTGQTLTGNASANMITGGSGADTLNGGIGNDRLIGGAGADSMNGGADNDTYVVDNAGDTITDSSGLDTVETALASYTLTTGIENLVGTSATGQALTGNALANNIMGGIGHDTLTGGAGSDILNGGNGDDNLYGDSAFTKSIVRVSTNGTGVEGNGNSRIPVFSPDGSKVAFYSFASNLVTGDTNSASDIFVKDLNTGVVTRVSTSSTGVQGESAAFNPVFSPDGSKVAFQSTSTNLVAGDTNFTTDIFVKDLNTGLTTRVSTDATGAQGNNNSINPVFSPDGNKLVFVSDSSNLVAGDTNNFYDIFVKDLNTGAIIRVSTDATGLQGNNISDLPVFSPDGSKVVFQSTASNLVTGDTNNFSDIFFKDLNTGAITRVSTDASGVQGNSNSSNPVFSHDGSKVVFSSFATNLVAGDTNSVSDIFVKDLTTGVVTRVSTDAAGVQGNSTSSNPVFSPDGSKVAFYSNATNLVAGDTNASLDIFVKDLVSGAITRVSTDALGVQGNGNSDLFVFSPDGSRILFESAASNLVVGDSGGRRDIFIANFDSPYSDTLIGGAGNDRLDGGTGGDDLRGGADNDTYVVDNAGDVITETTGIDTVETTLASYTIATGLENLTGLNSTGQTLTGNSAVNIIIAGSGGDRLDGGTGADDLRGGAGNDTYVVDNFGDVITDTSGTETVETTLASYTLTSGLENLTGTSGTGQTLTGNSGINIIIAGSDGDRLDGGAGADDLRGGAGSDTYVIDNAGDTITETSGIDTVETTLSSYALGAGLENLTGLNSTSQTLTGNSSVNIIIAGSGDDRLDGGIGADDLRGGAGIDTYVIDNTGDVITETSGIDTVETTLASYMLGAGLENLTGTSASGQTLQGNAVANIIRGAAGSDTLSGEGGDDSIIYDAADIEANVTGGLGTDTLLVIGQAAPLSFNLTAQGFEKAQVDETDAAMAFDWLNRSTTFNATWQKTNETGIYDNLDSWTSTYTNGFVTTFLFEDMGINNWAFTNYQQNLNTSGVLLSVTGLYDDNTTFSTTIDHLDVNTWASSTSTFSALDPNIVILQNGTMDNGDTWVSHYHSNGTLASYYYVDTLPSNEAYASYTNSYTNTNQLISTVGLNDNGTSFTTSYDYLDVEAISSVTTTLNGTIAVLQNGTYDSLDTWVSTYHANGNLATFTYTDGGPNDLSFNYYLINYNLAGVAISIEGQYDDNSTWFNLLP